MNCNNDYRFENGLDSLPDVFESEVFHSYQYFMNERNSDISSSTFGLVQDRMKNKGVASISATGFGLAAYVVGVQRGYIEKDEAEKQASRVLDTLLHQVQKENGFYYHFVDIKTGTRSWNCEASIIDTALCICGAFTAAEYFGGEIKLKALEMYRDVNWEWYRNKQTNQFYMGYSKEKGLFGAWSTYAEQLMMYILGAASPTHPVPDDMLYCIDRVLDQPVNIPPYIQSPSNSIFTYQFSHAFVDFRFTKDLNGVDFFANSIYATMQNRQFCIQHSSDYKTYGADSWGLTACDGPNGYCGCYGAAKIFENDGTVPPCGAAGSAPFALRLVNEALNHMNKIQGMTGEYGFYDSFYPSGEAVTVGNDYVGIDKGISLLMLANAEDGIVWKYFMKNEYVAEGMRKCGITKINDCACGYVCIDSPTVAGQKAFGMYYIENHLKESCRWLIEDNGDFIPIDSADEICFIPSQQMVGRQVVFEVSYEISGKAVRKQSLPARVLPSSFST